MTLSYDRSEPRHLGRLPVGQTGIATFGTFQLTWEVQLDHVAWRITDLQMFPHDWTYFHGVLKYVGWNRFEVGGQFDVYCHDWPHLRAALNHLYYVIGPQIALEQDVADGSWTDPAAPRIAYSYPRPGMPYSYNRQANARIASGVGDMSLSDWREMISMKAFGKIQDLDESFVGTPDYMGIAYFWNYEYRFELRDIRPDKKKAVHDAFLKAKLPLDEESPAHAAIIKRIVG